MSHKYSRELYNLRQDNLNNKYVYNPAYGDKFKQFKTIKVGDMEIRASLEYLVFELGHHEKEVLYQDKGLRTVHYDEEIITYDSINALVKVLNLSQGDMDGISSLLAIHKIGLDNFMKTRTENEEAISEMREEKTIKISEMRKIAEEIQEGKSDDEKSGLNYLARVQGDKTRVQMNILNKVNLIGGIFALLAAIGIGLYIPYSISKPLANLSRTANDIGKGNLDAKIELRSNDEIGELAASFNKMTQDLRVSRDDIISAKKYTDNILRYMIDTLLVVSPDGTIQTVNPATCTLLGYKEKELIGEPVSKVVADGKEILINISTFVEKTYLAKDGRKIPMLFSGSVMRDDNGNTQGIVCIAQDITGRKQAEEALKKLSSAVEQSADSVIITNKEGFIEYVNPAFEKLTGYDNEESIGNTPNILKSGKHDKNYYKNLYETIYSGMIFQDELINKKKNGEIYYAETTIVPIKDAEGTITHFVTTEKDITEHKKTEKIQLENKRLSYASKAKSDFLANMSHELRTPLNSIIGFSELLKQKMSGELNDKQMRFVDNILTGGNMLLNLISDILDLSKIEAGKMELVLEKIHVPEVINGSLILMKEKAAKHNVKMKLDLDPELDYMDADELRIKQVLFNLLSNAVKFSKPEGGTITITTKKEGDWAKFSVSDTGIGIKEENLEKLFKTFEQLDSGITRNYGGTGLGLAISKKLIELHGGNIGVESKFGIGTTFYFTIPIKRR